MYIGDMNVSDNKAQNRFEVETPNGLAFVNYRLRGDIITFTHTEVPLADRGHGIAEQLARAALDNARERKLRVVASCAYIAAFVKRHTEYQDLLADE